MPKNSLLRKIKDKILRSKSRATFDNLASRIFNRIVSVRDGVLIKHGHFGVLFPDTEYRLILQHMFGSFHLREYIFISSFLREGDIYVDVGANYGVTSLYARRAVGEDGEVFAFEANPAVAKYIDINAQINFPRYYANIKTYNYAVSNDERKLKLFIADYAAAGSTQYKFDHKEMKEIEVDTITLDNFFDKDKKIDFVKIDVEGAETDVIEGMLDIIERNKEHIVLFLEFYEWHFQRGGHSSEKLYNKLKEFGFEIFQVDFRRRKLLRRSYQQIIAEEVDVLCTARKDILKKY